jgi:excisionase family DNA binding protein
MSAGKRQPLTLAELLSRIVITVPEYAATFDVDERTARRAIKEGQLQALQVGATWRIPVAPLLRRCGMDPEDSEAVSATDTAARYDSRHLKAIRHGHFDPARRLRARTPTGHAS